MLLAVVMMMMTCALAWGRGESNAELYEKALGLLKDNDYQKAGEAFAELGSYGDSPRYVMYCSAIAAGEAGMYAVAVDNLKSLGGFLDSSLLAVYYAGLSWEASEDYERAAEVMSGITLYRDVATRIAGYPALCDARDYRKADENEQAGRFEAALSGFKALGNYEDSADRAVAVQEKIYARDYAEADEAEQKGQLEDALTGFEALEDYSDSAERAAAVRQAIRDRDDAAAELARAAAYEAADQAEQDGDYASAYNGFVELGDYRDSAVRAAAVQEKGNYANAIQCALSGDYDGAYALFNELGDYEDSAQKAYALGVTTFAKVSDRKNGIAAFQFHDLWGLINVGTNTTVSPYWDQIGEFNVFGLAPVEKDGLSGYINTIGEVVVPCRWYQVGAFSDDGLCTVVREETQPSGWSSYNYYYFGLYDAQGREVTPAVWRSLGDSYNYSWDNSYNLPKVYLPMFSDGKIRTQNADAFTALSTWRANLWARSAGSAYRIIQKTWPS